MKRLALFVCCLFLTVWMSVFAQEFEDETLEAIYVPSYWDSELLDSIDEHIDTYIDEGDRNEIIYLLVRTKDAQPRFEYDPQATFILYEIVKMLEEALAFVDENQDLYGAIQEIRDTEDEEPKEVVEEPVVVSEPTVQELPEESEDDAQPQEEDDGLPPVVEVPTPLQEFTRSAFLDTYESYMKWDTPLYESCFTYFDSIDALAKQNDFPTALIISTWYREHSCFLSNPGNGWWNFQITSHDYPEGDIDIDEFLVQVQHFIDFSRGKWDYYDNVQKFWPEPIVLQYDNFDLSSIRKHAIFYNGVYPDVTLDKSRYSNENFTRERGGRDWIVAWFIKVLQWERDR